MKGIQFLALFGCLAILVLTARVALTDNDGDGTRENPFHVPECSSGVRVDGVLDDTAWVNALTLELKYEVRPGENISAPVKTEVLLTYDNSHLYIGFRAYDGNPSEIRAHLGDHDNLGYDDWVGVVLDTFNDERRSILFLSNPIGVQFDAIEVSNTDPSWDCIWDCAGKIHDWGYAVEMAIPFNQIRFQRTNGPQVWGFDGIRSYPRSVDHRIGLFPRDRDNNCYLCQAPKIKGFEGIKPGRNVEVDPTLTAVRTDARSSMPDGKFEERDRKADLGVTARWGITPNMTLSATLNPDFSQVEADALQLDINQPFALYYSEKRPFFTEGFDYFSTPGEVVYTRTMRDPIWGVKLTGKEGSNTVGAYVVRDSLTNLIFPGSQRSQATSIDMESTSAVLRYRRDIWNNSTIGVLMTNRQGGDYFNRQMTVDGRLRFTSADALEFQVSGSSTRYPDEIATDFGQPKGDFSDLGWYAGYTHSTRDYWISASHLSVGNDFRADAGFIPQVGYRTSEVGGGYRWYSTGDNWFNRIQIEANWDKTHEDDGSPLEEEIEGFIVYNGPMHSEVLTFFGKRDRCYNDIFFGQTFKGFFTRIMPSGSLELNLFAEWEDGIDYDHSRAGKVFSISPEAGLNISRNFRLSLDYHMQRMEVEGGRLYMANLYQTRIVYQFNVRTFLRAILHYSDIRFGTELYAFPVEPVERDLFTQLLFSYKINPQTVLFLGYSDNHLGTASFGLTQTDRTFFVKIGYAWIL